MWARFTPRDGRRVAAATRAVERADLVRPAVPIRGRYPVAVGGGGGAVAVFGVVPATIAAAVDSGGERTPGVGTAPRLARDDADGKWKPTGETATIENTTNEAIPAGAFDLKADPLGGGRYLAIVWSCPT